MGEYSAVSGIKVLDRAVAIMMAAANRPSSLNELCETTGLPRATAHRLATALEAHRILTRTEDGKWGAGPALPGNRDHLLEAAGPVMDELLEATGESVQLYELSGNTRTCIATREPESGLHNVVPVGRQLPLNSGSAARVIAAFADVSVPDALYTAEDVAAAKKQGYSESIEEREAGLASISAPVVDSQGTFLAVLSISGSAERFRPSPAEKYADLLLDAATRLRARL
ncbi:IclR family transcriptional regulator [Corynebacterium camporealensis]|uniref:Transcriptional regulator, IclR family n=1 Tax=Corynebacterium camporealensis TaxID=161896 RepID=A0A0F6QWM2_9CORY|nr:IclR family transcriptional regulator [Corynebacterium camporealensis]AKE39045.1 transcriptional regulator, IclR family [Corynebacterium camporealensis]MDY5840530.1 IclR family transcriptional regulator [Corynebacterium camporealensis]